MIDNNQRSIFVVYKTFADNENQIKQDELYDEIHHSIMIFKRRGGVSMFGLSLRLSDLLQDMYNCGHLKETCNTVILTKSGCAHYQTSKKQIEKDNESKRYFQTKLEGLKA